MVRSIPGIILTLFLAAWLPVCFIPHIAVAQNPGDDSGEADDVDAGGDADAGGGGANEALDDLKNTKKLTVAVTKVEVKGDINELLSETLKEGLKSEVRQNKNIDIVLEGGNITLSDLILYREKDCKDVDSPLTGTPKCFDSIAAFLQTESIAFAFLEPTAFGYEVDMYWYVSTDAGGSGEAGKFFRSSIVDYRVDGSDFDFENAVPNLSFSLFGGTMNTLVVDSNVKGAQVWLIDSKGNKKRVGVTPYQDERIPIGEAFHIELKKEGFQKWSTQTAKEYGKKPVEITDGPPIEVTAQLEVEDTGLGRLSEMLTLIGWAVTGTGLAFLIAGLVTGIIMSTTQSDFDAELVGGINDFDQAARARQLREDGHGLANTTNVLLGIGGALAVVGITLLILGYTEALEEKKEEDEVEEEEGQAFRFDSFNVYADPEGGMGAVIGFTF